ncbi:MAG: SDR family oxidoreductase [Akkermansiaceae bacterium]|nr:SDR family oxidoreductase [Armatimonadota bacterium]
MNRTVLITGASSGIGAASARRFAREGWNVVATMRDPKTVGDLASLPQVLVTRLDVEDPASTELAIAAAVNQFGRLDVLINNAGYAQYGLFEAVPREKVRQQFAVNVFGVMDVTRAALPHLRARGGVILNISSGIGVFTLPLFSLYSASKFALEGFSESLSYELASQKIAVKIIEPHGGVTSTNFAERQAEDAVADPSLANYDEFVTRINATFAAMTGARTLTADRVADVVFEAATDGTDRLRYPIGDDTRGFYHARKTMSDDDYSAFMRAQFTPQTQNTDAAGERSP